MGVIIAEIKAYATPYAQDIACTASFPYSLCENDEVGTDKHSPVRLPNFLQLVRIIATMIVVVFLFLVWRFPHSFGFIAEPQLFLSAMLIFSIINPLFSLFVPRLVQSKVFYSAYLYNILWALFITALLYTMGGIESFFAFALVFPILTTAFDLEARATLLLGICTEVLIVILMLFDVRVPHDASYYVSGGILMLLIGLFSFYLFKLIKESVRQRFEKEEMTRRYADLAEIDRAKSTFVTAASHQLRTPLSELRWSLDAILKTKRWNRETAETLERSRESVTKLVNIVHTLTQIESLERPGLVHTIRTMNMTDMLDSVVHTTHTLAEQKGVRVSFSRPTGLCAISGDETMLKNAFANILENAILYAPHGIVTVTLTPLQKGCAVTVADTGIGIAPQDQPRLFTKFFRADNAVQLEPDRTGVGLFIAKSAIEKHYGTIAINSKLGAGTEVRVVLPVAPRIT